MADRAVDRTVNNTSGFTATSKTTHLTTASTTGHYRLVKRIDGVQFSSANATGELIFNIPVNPDLAPECRAMADKFEFVQISNIQLDMAAVSPLGTTSGALQIAHITDPANATFSPGATADNVKKVVRQQGSVTVRPRDTIELKITTAGQKFTTKAGSTRFNNYGNLVAVVRNAPLAGTSCEWVATITGDFHFSRMSSHVDAAASAQLATLQFETVPQTSGDKRVIMIPVPTSVLPGKADFTLSKPISATHVVDRTRHNIRHIQDCIVRDGFAFKRIDYHIAKQEMSAVITNRTLPSIPVDLTETISI
jgi:hypothetical protein